MFRRKKKVERNLPYIIGDSNVPSWVIDLTDHGIIIPYQEKQRIGFIKEPKDVVYLIQTSVGIQEGHIGDMLIYNNRTLVLYTRETVKRIQEVE